MQSLKQRAFCWAIDKEKEYPESPFISLLELWLCPSSTGDEWMDRGEDVTVVLSRGFSLTSDTDHHEKASSSLSPSSSSTS